MWGLKTVIDLHLFVGAPESSWIIIIIIIYRFLERHKSLGYRGAGGVSIRQTVGIGKS